MGLKRKVAFFVPNLNYNLR